MFVCKKFIRNTHSCICMQHVSQRNKHYQLFIMQNDKCDKKKNGFAAEKSRGTRNAYIVYMCVCERVKYYKSAKRFSRKVEKAALQHCRNHKVHMQFKYAPHNTHTHHTCTYVHFVNVVFIWETVTSSFCIYSQCQMRSGFI